MVLGDYGDGEKAGGATRTIGNALKVVVCLGNVQLGADPFVVDFVLHVAEEDEGCDDAGAARRLDLGLDVAIPHVDGRGQHGAHRVGRHGEEHVAVVDQWLALGDPVSRRRVAQVLVDVGDAVEAVHGELAILAHGDRHACVERGRHSRVAAAEAVGSNAALAVFWTSSHVSLSPHHRYEGRRVEDTRDAVQPVAAGWKPGMRPPHVTRTEARGQVGTATYESSMALPWDISGSTSTSARGPSWPRKGQCPTGDRGSFWRSEDVIGDRPGQREATAFVSRRELVKVRSRLTEPRT